MSGSPKTTKRLPLPGVLQVAGHVEVGVHACLQHRDAAEPVELGGVGLVVEGAGDQHVEARVGRLARRHHEVKPRDRPELGADKDAGSLLRAGPLTLDVAPLGADVRAWPRRNSG